MKGDDRKKRDAGIDFAKAVCIALVVFAHLPRLGRAEASLTCLVDWIYLFHVPVFAVLSGWFCGGRSGCARILRLAGPYLFGNILLLVGYWLACRFGTDTTQNPVAEKGWTFTMLRIATGGGLAATWYLGALMGIEAIMIAVHRLSRLMCASRNPPPPSARPEWICVSAILLASAFLPRGWFGPAIPAWFASYFCIGWLARRLECELPRSKSGIIFVCASFLVKIGERGLSPGTIVLSVSMLATLLWLGDAVNRTAPRMSAFMSFIGQRTLPILIFHPIFNVVLRGFQRRWLALDPSGCAGMLLTAVASMAMCLMLDFTIRRTVLRRLFYFGAPLVNA